MILGMVGVFAGVEAGRAAGITVDTLSAEADGDTSSISALQATPGADGAILLREAMEAANNTAGADLISFSVQGSILAPYLPPMTDSTGGTTLSGDQNSR